MTQFIAQENYLGHLSVITPEDKGGIAEIEYKIADTRLRVRDYSETLEKESVFKDQEKLKELEKARIDLRVASIAAYNRWQAAIGSEDYKI